MDSLQFAILVIIHQVSLAGGVVTIAFDDYGYIGQSIVLQCKTDAASIVSLNAIWYFNGIVLNGTSTGRYNEIKTSDGFNLTISDLTTADAGYYRCRIDFGSSSNKTLGILSPTPKPDTATPASSTSSTTTLTSGNQLALGLGLGLGLGIPFVIGIIIGIVILVKQYKGTNSKTNGKSGPV